ncbi:MAG TPA: CSLREA domain-containing protein, partial [Candidatus Sumerlaeota bacterium]|nr:CSLREA domain-containing protein [Candidatus Sumerlaeota bacterium]
MRLRLLAAILVSLLPLLHAASLTAALFTVTTTADENDGTPDPGVEGTSLREAILAANANAEADEIRFDAALAGDELSVSLFDTGRSDGEFGPTAFSVFTEIEINGPAGDDGITIKRAGGDNFRLFHVTITGDLTLRNLTLQGGVAQGFDGGSGGGGGGGSAGVGGAVLNQGTLTLDGSTLTGNMALGGHGANSGNANDRGGGGGAGVGQHGADGASETFGVTAPGGAGGDPNGGAPAGSGGGGDGGSGITAAASVVGGPGADGGFFFGGGGGGGSARSASGNSQTGGAGGAGGYGGGDGSAGGAGTNSPNGDG